MDSKSQMAILGGIGLHLHHGIIPSMSLPMHFITTGIQVALSKERLFMIQPFRFVRTKQGGNY